MIVEKSDHLRSLDEVTLEELANIRNEHIAEHNSSMDNLKDLVSRDKFIKPIEAKDMLSSLIGDYDAVQSIGVAVEVYERVFTKGQALLESISGATAIPNTYLPQCALAGIRSARKYFPWIIRFSSNSHDTCN